MVFKSTFEDVVAPAEYKECLSFFIWHQLDVFADKTLFVDYESGREWTGKQIKEEAIKLAGYLINELGLKPGQGCALVGTNNDYIQLLSVAVTFAGGIICAGERLDPQPEHEYMITCLEPAIVFSNTCHYERFEEIRKSRLSAGLSSYKICILDDNIVTITTAGLVGLHTHMRSYQNGENVPLPDLPILVDSSTACYTLFSSGSTGKRKPVPRSQRNALYTCLALKSCPQLWKLDDTCVMAGHLPLNHGTGMFCTKTALTQGCKLIIMEGYVQSQLLDAVEKYRITEIMLASVFVQNIITSEDTKGRDLSSLRNFIPVGSRLPSHADAIAFMRRNPMVSVRQFYGLSEFGFVTFLPVERAQTDTKSVGLLLPNVLAKLLDMSTGEEINEPNKLGELYVSGPTLCSGYLGAHLVEHTKAAFLEDGYYKTNDMAMFDERQHLFVEARIDEVIYTIDSMKVSPSEIEGLISEHPQVKEVAVIGVQDPKVPICYFIRAFVVPKDTNKLTAQDVTKWVAERTSEPKHLNGGVKIMDSLPRITLGKINKKALRQIQL